MTPRKGSLFFLHLPQFGFLRSHTQQKQRLITATLVLLAIALDLRHT
jgi:hypothetical protein